MSDTAVAEAPAKTSGDYAVEIDRKLQNNTTDGVQPIIDEMRAQAAAEAPPVDPNAPVEPAPEPPAPVDLGLEGFADELQAAVDAHNVAKVREIVEDMYAVSAPAVETDEATIPEDLKQSKKATSGGATGATGATDPVGGDTG